MFSKNQASKTTNPSTASKQGFFEQRQSVPISCSCLRIHLGILGEEKEVNKKLQGSSASLNVRFGNRRRICWFLKSRLRRTHSVLKSHESSVLLLHCHFSGLAQKKIGTFQSGQSQTRPLFGGYVLELLESFSGCLARRLYIETGYHFFAREV